MKENKSRKQFKKMFKTMGITLLLAGILGLTGSVKHYNSLRQQRRAPLEINPKVTETIRLEEKIKSISIPKTFYDAELKNKYHELMEDLENLHSDANLTKEIQDFKDYSKYQYEIEDKIVGIMPTMVLPSAMTCYFGLMGIYWKKIISSMPSARSKKEDMKE